MVKDGRLPPPDFPFGNRFPAWDADVLDQHDRAVVTAARVKRDAGAAARA
jgi:hypothetical protein